MCGDKIVKREIFFVCRIVIDQIWFDNLQIAFIKERNLIIEIKCWLKFYLEHI